MCTAYVLENIKIYIFDFCANILAVITLFSINISFRRITLFQYLDVFRLSINFFKSLYGCQLGGSAVLCHLLRLLADCRHLQFRVEEDRVQIRLRARQRYDNRGHRELSRCERQRNYYFGGGTPTQSSVLVLERLVPKQILS